MVLYKDMVYDNWNTNRNGTPVSEYSKRLKRLKSVIHINGTVTRNIKQEFKDRKLDEYCYHLVDAPEGMIFKEHDLHSVSAFSKREARELAKGPFIPCPQRPTCECCDE